VSGAAALRPDCPPLGTAKQGTNLRLPKFNVDQRQRARGARVIGCMYEKPILERAFELARSGDYPRVKELEKALSREGYAKGDPHIHSPSVRKQLRSLCLSSYSLELA
jgi:hypothetical protein